MHDLGRHIRLSLRGLARTPAFTITSLLILAFGIGTAVAMFTIFRAVLVERLPVRDPERIVVLSTYGNSAGEFGFVKQDLKDLRRDSRTLTDVAGYAHWGATPTPLIDGDRALTLGGVVATGRFFSVLGTRPLLGRLLRDDDDVKGALPVIVLSYKAWKRDFGGDPKIVGRRLTEPYEQKSCTIIGVAPPGLDYPVGAEYWTIRPDADFMSIIGIGRLAPGATPAAAASELLSIVQRLLPEFRLTAGKAIGLSQAILGDVRPVLVVLTAAVVLLLVIACVNVGSLLLLRAGGRARELAIRRALGATYGDVVRHLLLESILLAAAGGALGLACAEALIRILIAFSPTELPRSDVIGIGGAPVAAALGVTSLAVLLFGVIPALMAARADVASTLRLDARSGRDSSARRRVRHVLVASQTTLALVMLCASALLGRSLARLQALDLGYETSHLSLLAPSFPATRYDTMPKLYPLAEQIMQRWRAIPGVTSVTPTLIQPLLGDNVFLGPLAVEGEPARDRAADPVVPVWTGGRDYFRTFGTPLIRGRAFTDADREDAPYVAIVSESVARRVWPGQDPIGKRIHYWADSTVWRTVVGVAADTHLRLLREATPTVYVPWRQSYFQMNFAIRTSGTLSSVLPALRRELQTVDPLLALWFAHPMDELLAGPLARPRMSAILMSAFGGAALLLAAIGLYGLMASVVRERTREIGIRIALGAEPARLRRDVLGQALAISGIGAVVGLVAALATSRLLSKLLFEVSPTDPIALGAACAILLSVAVAAAYAPARWATKIDPARALRAD